MATIVPRTTKGGNTRYRVQVRLRGHRPQSNTFDRLTDARKWAQQTEAAIHEGRHFPYSAAKRRKVADLIDRYVADVLPQKPKSILAQHAQLIWWREQIGDCLLSDLSPSLIAECRDRLAKIEVPGGYKRSPGTVNRYMAPLSHALNIAMKEWGWIHDNPMLRVTKFKESRGRVRFLSDDERDRLLAVCRDSSSTFLYPAVILAISTGMRRGELLGLSWKDIDLDREMITLHDTKNNERRAVPLKGLASRPRSGRTPATMR